jgi:hypothetical protein
LFGVVAADVRRRWLTVLAAAVGAATLAGGTAIAADQAFSAQTMPAPKLKGVSAAALSQLQVSLRAAQLPPYCGVLSAADGHGIAAPANTGCPVSRSAAQAALGGSFPAGAGSSLGVSTFGPAGSTAAAVQDAVLARASAPRQPVIGSDRLVWLFVVQGAFPAYRMRPIVPCPAPPLGGVPRSACRGPLANLTELVFVDAQTSRYLAALPVGASAGPITIHGGATARTLPFTTAP